MLRCSGPVGAAILAACITSRTLLAQGTTVAEDELKAAFLYNFAKYVSWPDAALSKGPLRLCVFADASFTKKVDEIIFGETIDGRHVVRLPAPVPQDIGRDCNVVFVGRSDSNRTSELIATARESHVLTVGEGDAFLAHGGMVTLVKDGDRVRFDVNLTEAQRAGLIVSSRLLRLARHIISGMTGPTP